MTTYLIGVLIAFILYRIGRYIENKYQNKLSQKSKTGWAEAFGFYAFMLTSYVAAVIIGAIVVIMIADINKDKELPKWL